MTINRPQLPFHPSWLVTAELGRNPDAADNYDGASVCRYTGDTTAHTTANMSALMAETRLDTVVQPRQRHTNHVAIVDASNCQEAFDGIDAVVTSTPGILIGINTADCVPILLCDVSRRIIGAVHAGWRGTAARIVDTAIDAMLSLGANRPDIVAYIGAAICGHCYEVGSEVVDAIANASVPTSQFLVTDTRWSKPHVDLKAANRAILEQNGIKPARIAISPVCTLTTPSCYSARRQGIDSGRNFTAIGMRK